MFLSKPPRAFVESRFNQPLRAVKRSHSGVLGARIALRPERSEYGNNLGNGSPVVHWHELENARGRGVPDAQGWRKREYGHPVQPAGQPARCRPGTWRVRRCVLSAVLRAQGKERLGSWAWRSVAIGRRGYEESKRQLLRKIGERSPEPALAELEVRLLEEVIALALAGWVVEDHVAGCVCGYALSLARIVP